MAFVSKNLAYLLSMRVFHNQFPDQIVKHDSYKKYTISVKQVNNNYFTVLIKNIVYVPDIPNSTGFHVFYYTEGKKDNTLFDKDVNVIQHIQLIVDTKRDYNANIWLVNDLHFFKMSSDQWVDFRLVPESESNNIINIFKVSDVDIVPPLSMQCIECNILAKFTDIVIESHSFISFIYRASGPQETIRKVLKISRKVK